MRVVVLPFLAAAALWMAPGVASAATGDLSQLPGSAGCHSEDGSAGECVDGKGLGEARAVAISPDGESVYVASPVSDDPPVPLTEGIAAFDRDVATGELTQLAGTAGCVTENGSAGACADGTALGDPVSVAVSPDGANVYVASEASDAVAVLSRSEATGELTPLAGTAGCVSRTGSGGDCADGEGLSAPQSVAVSPDGTSVYVASKGSNTVEAFGRSPTTGALTQLSGADGCVSEASGGPCEDGKALRQPASVTVAPNGASVYVTSSESDAVAAFDRDGATGALNQRSGTDGCVSQTGTSGACLDGKALDGAVSVAVDPDGGTVYVASQLSDAVAVFDRAPSGSLTQRAGNEGCVSETGAGPCADGKALDGPFAVAVSPDGLNVYTASFAGTSDAIAIFDRDESTGVLAQHSGTGGCVSATGTGLSCTVGRALADVDSVAVSPDGKGVYAASAESHAVSVFERETTVQTTIASGPSGPTNDETPTFEFTSSEPGSTFECRVDTAAFAPCSSPHTTASLGQGDHTFEVRATDPGGNADPTPATRSFHVDTAAPETSIDSGPSGTTNDPTPTFDFSSSESGSTFQCRVDTGAFAPCSAPLTTGQLSDGQHTFEVRATDPAGNVDQTPASRTFTVDASAPQTTIDVGPPADTSDPTPTLEFSASEGGSTFECRVDNDSFGSCSSPHTTSQLSDGQHTFEVRATDPAGNTDQTPATRTFRVDTGAPETSIDSGPGGQTSDSTPTYDFSSSQSGSTFECRVDTDAFAPCSAPHTTGELSDGQHTFEVRATDAAGNADQSPASRTFTVDTSAPETTIDSGPSGTTEDQTPEFQFSASEGGSTFECRVDGGSFGSCDSPHTTDELPDGQHTFEVRATDAAGNADQTPASRTFTVAAPPETSVDGGPGGPTNDSTPSFDFSSNESGSSFECRVDSDAFATCSSPHTTGQLTNGDHAFEVRATDPAGNTDQSPASRGFSVDTSAPDTTLDSGPSGTTEDATPTFEFSSGDSGAGFECRVDGGSYDSCSSPHTTDQLSDGEHSFDVRAVDTAGNADQSPAGGSFTVDTTPPDTTAPEASLTTAPSSPTSDNTAQFRFDSNEAGSGFFCKLDTAGWKACTSPYTTAVLADGAHVFQVTAVDQAGNFDLTPAKHTFVVDTTGPRMAVSDDSVRLTKDGVAAVLVECPSSERSGPCSGTLKLKTTEPVKVDGDRQRVTLGSEGFEIQAGDDRKVKVQLSSSNRKLVDQLGKVDVKGTATAADRLGNSAKGSASFLLKAP